MQDKAFARNLAPEGIAAGSSFRGGDSRFAPPAAIDDRGEAYWARDDSTLVAWLGIAFPRPERLSCAVLREPIVLGQFIASSSMRSPGGAAISAPRNPVRFAYSE
jgi:hypothetical protein